MCNTAPTQGTLGISSAKLVVPGHPGQSILSLRMHATGADRMPALGSAMVDPAGTALVDSWITSLASCP